MKRQIIFDTETTGLKTADGNRIVEIGALELIDGEKTGKTFHYYINPRMTIPLEVINIHGITDEKVKDAPFFEDIVDEFIEFIKDAEILAHNMKFDKEFVNYELGLAQKGSLSNYIKKETCTLELSRRLFVEEFIGKDKKKLKHKLDHMCERLGINNDHREFHGALLDSDLLADVYIKICKLFSKEELELDLEQRDWVRPPITRFDNIKLSEIQLTDEDETKHINFLIKMKEKDKVNPVYSTDKKILKV